MAEELQAARGITVGRDTALHRTPNSGETCRQAASARLGLKDPAPALVSNGRMPPIR